MSDHMPTLVETEAGLTLTDGRLSLTADFTSMLPRLRRGNLQSELLVKAARIKGLSRPVRIVDATAGLGEDSLLFAAAGFSVRLYESDPVIAALLRDALARLFVFAEGRAGEKDEAKRLRVVLADIAVKMQDHTVVFLPFCRISERMTMVTGPSVDSSVRISAPKTPVST